MVFTEWFKNNVSIFRFPTPGEIERSKFDYIINVSDEHIEECAITAHRKGIRYFWFPLSELIGTMGINSIYGAMQILHLAEKENKKVLLHCHSGANRSQTVGDCYYFARTGTHRQRTLAEDKEISEWLGLPYTPKQKHCRLVSNIEQGRLPSKKRMETFLRLSIKAFEKESTNRGGQIDMLKQEADIHS